jgi:hypothetical protein
VILTTAKNAVIHTGLAEIEVTIIAGAAMIVFIWDSLAAVVAVDGEYADGGNRSRWSISAWARLLAIIGQSSQLCKPLVPSSSTTSDRNLSARAVVHSRSLLVMEHAGNFTLELAAARSHRGHACCASGAGSGLIDEKLLESTLDLGNRAGIDCVLRVAHGR